MSRFLVSSDADGFRRAGRAWSTSPVEVDGDEFTEDQWAALRADPSITVHDTHAARETGGASAAGAKSSGGPGSPQREGSPAPRSPGAGDPESRGARIRAAVEALEPDRPDHWTKSGMPNVEALRELSGLADVSAAERDAAWKEAGA